MTQTSSPPEASGATEGWTRWWRRTRYQLYAPVYDWAVQPLERGRRRAIERLDPTSADRILILGCGPGSDLEYLPSDASITAMDAAPAMVRRAAARAEALGMDVETQVGDAQALPFEDDAFDAVLLHLILAVVSEPAAVAAETTRVLAPDGRASIYDKFIPDGTTPSLLRRLLNPVARFFFTDLTLRLGPLLEQAGLQESGPRDDLLGGLFTVVCVRPTRAKATSSNEG